MQFSSFAERIIYFEKHPEQLPKVLVLYGGETNEREVSIESGKAVAQGLREGKASVVEYEVNSWSSLISDLPTLRATHQFDVVFNLIHGGAGENGALHSLLDMLSMPYVGSSPLSSALAMDKALCKKVWMDLGLNIPQFHLIRSPEEAARLNLSHFPLIVKPSSEGSSNGISKVENTNDLEEAVAKAFEYDEQVLIEDFIEGDEVTVAIVDNQPLTPIEIIPQGGIYDYHAKYISDDTQFFCPPKHIQSVEFSKLYKAAKTAYQAIGARHWGRVDFIIDQNATAWILEVNLIPGMTSHSLVPQAAKQKGISFSQLVCGLAASAV